LHVRLHQNHAHARPRSPSISDIAGRAASTCCWCPPQLARGLWPIAHQFAARSARDMGLPSRNRFIMAAVCFPPSPFSRALNLKTVGSCSRKPRTGY
jgi:hypothetical protein